LDETAGEMLLLRGGYGIIFAVCRQASVVSGAVVALKERIHENLEADA
jgi:hypothetical protein